MRLLRTLLGILTILIGSNTAVLGQLRGQSGTSQDTKDNKNMLAGLNHENLGDFHWMNTPEHYAFTSEGVFIEASEGTDFFNNPENLERVGSAPFLYSEVSGDFVAIAQVKPNFEATWNACALMVYIDQDNWIKFAFENSDATGPGIVTVVTREVSDDANGAVLEEHQEVWLKLIRKGNLYAMHWSTDGTHYKMARLSAMPDQMKVKIGMEAQCPSEGPASHAFLFFSLEQKTIGDLRKGE